MKRTAVILVLILGMSEVYATTVTEASVDEQTTAVARPEKCKTPLHIATVDSDDLLKALQHIKDCVTDSDKLDVYVSGPGGSISEAQAFYDQMHTLGFSKRVRFRAYGIIGSASNIVWMAADERVVTPSSMFILHKASVNVDGEDPELGVSIKDLQVVSTTNAIRRTAGMTAARLWEESLTGKVVATAFNGREAVKNGWATSLEEYK